VSKQSARPPCFRIYCVAKLIYTHLHLAVRPESDRQCMILHFKGITTNFVLPGSFVHPFNLLSVSPPSCIRQTPLNIIPTPFAWTENSRKVDAPITFTYSLTNRTSLSIPSFPPSRGLQHVPRPRSFPPADPLNPCCQHASVILALKRYFRKVSRRTADAGGAVTRAQPSRV
jgi:hypothetical protein